MRRYQEKEFHIVSLTGALGVPGGPAEMPHARQRKQPPFHGRVAMTMRLWPMVHSSQCVQGVVRKEQRPPYDELIT